MTYEGKEMSMTKSKLCWLLQKDHVKLSSDVRERFIEKKSFEIVDISSDDIVWKSEIVSRGNWVVVVVEKYKFFVGFVVNFNKKMEKSKSKRLYRFDSVTINKKSKDVYMLLDPLYKIVRKNLELQPNREYYCIDKYICNVLNDALDFKNALKLITKLYQESIN